MTDPAPPRHPTLYERYLPHRRWVEIGYWVIAVVVSAIGNTLTVTMELNRAGYAFHPMEPAIWEWSSNGVILALVPAVAWFTRRFPLHLDTWRRQLPWYALASFAYCLVHVVGMVAIRKAIYLSVGESYDFGSWPRQLLYEYIKDIRTFAGAVLVIEVYRFLLRRLQGEASLLDAPDDDAPPVEPVERPERFLVRKLGREFLVAAADIEALQAAGNYVNLRVRGRD
ncbi:MAG TPA: LytTR family transcriptional regulator, partial [Arenimonas sp.]|nr:LytTR family transcriptional regulator [Arenimonas sp.]